MDHLDVLADVLVVGILVRDGHLVKFLVEVKVQNNL